MKKVNQSTTFRFWFGSHYFLKCASTVRQLSVGSCHFSVDFRFPYKFKLTTVEVNKMKVNGIFHLLSSTRFSFPVWISIRGFHFRDLIYLILLSNYFHRELFFFCFFSTVHFVFLLVFLNKHKIHSQGRKLNKGNVSHLHVVSKFFRWHSKSIKICRRQPIFISKVMLINAFCLTLNF